MRPRWVLPRPDPGLGLGLQIRRYKANKEVMEKAAEVYTRLKSRVLGPRMEAAPKVSRSGTETAKAEEVLAGEEVPAEKPGEQAGAGEGGWAGGVEIGGRGGEDTGLMPGA